MKIKPSVHLIALGSIFLFAFLGGSWLGQKKANAQPFGCAKIQLSSCNVPDCDPCHRDYVHGGENNWNDINKLNDPKVFTEGDFRVALCFQMQ